MDINEIERLSLLNKLALQQVDDLKNNITEPKHINLFYALYRCAVDEAPLIEEISEYLEKFEEYKFHSSLKINFLQTIKKDYNQRILILKSIDAENISLAEEYYRTFKSDFLSEYIRTFLNWVNFLISTVTNKEEIKNIEKSTRINFVKHLRRTINKFTLFVSLIDLEIDNLKQINKLNEKDFLSIPQLEQEKILWRGTKQDLVALFDILFNLNFLISAKNKDILLGQHFAIINQDNEVKELGELKHTRKLLKESAKPSERMQIIIDAINKSL